MAKRGNNRIQNSLTIKQIYQYYIKDYNDDSKYHIDYKLYRILCEEFNKEISSLIIKDGYFFKVPYRLGTIRIKKRKIDIANNNLKINFGLYNKSNGQYTNKHLNEHSGGYYVKFQWVKLDMIMRNKAFYSFIPTRANKRMLASVVKEEGEFQVNKYFE